MGITLLQCMCPFFCVSKVPPGRPKAINVDQPEASIACPPVDTRRSSEAVPAATHRLAPSSAQSGQPAKAGGRAISSDWPPGALVAPHEWDDRWGTRGHRCRADIPPGRAPSPTPTTLHPATVAPTRHLHPLPTTTKRPPPPPPPPPSPHGGQHNMSRHPRPRYSQDDPTRARAPLHPPSLLFAPVPPPPPATPARGPRAQLMPFGGRLYGPRVWEGAPLFEHNGGEMGHARLHHGAPKIWRGTCPS